MNDDRGNTVTFKNLVQGVEHAIQPRRIWANGTTATNIELLY